MIKGQKKEVDSIVTNAKYLKITIHDNDFTTTLQLVGKTLYSIFQEENKFPSETELDTLKPLIKYLWYSIHELQSVYRWKDTSINPGKTDISYFEPQLEIVEYENIPNWNNYENLYIPLLSGSSLLLV